MDQVNWFNQIIDFAIEREVEANQFYLELAETMQVPAMAEVFRGFAAEELAHKAKLDAIRHGEIVVSEPEKVETLKITDYIVDVELMANMTYEQALVLAMQKEKAAYKLYMDLAGLAGDAQQRDVFLAMAAEEAKHKLRFEIEYDDNVLQED